MEIFLDPNVAYLLLAGGLIFAILAILNPGTGLLEISALFALIAAGWSVYGLAELDRINWWSLLVILVGIVLFVAAIRYPKMPVYLVISIACLVIGSAFLFRSEIWYVPAVNPYLASILSILSGGFFWVTARKVLEAKSIQPTHDLEALIGAFGEAKSEVHKEGSVQVSGELWTARSDELIPNGSKIRVIGREGFSLKVEAVEE